MSKMSELKHRLMKIITNNHSESVYSNNNNNNNKDYDENDGKTTFLLRRHNRKSIQIFIIGMIILLLIYRITTEYYLLLDSEISLSESFWILAFGSGLSNSGDVDDDSSNGNQADDRYSKPKVPIITRMVPLTRRHLMMSSKRKSTLKYATKNGKVLALAPHITQAMVHSKTGQRMFGCLRIECQGLAMEDLSDRKWRQMFKSAKESALKFKEGINYRVTILLTDTTELTRLKKIRHDLWTMLVHGQLGKTYIGTLDNADVIGGNKGLQLRSKAKLTERHGCSYNTLRIQPAQYRLYEQDECEALLAHIGRPTTFLLKPETGSQGQGITFHKDVKSVQKKVGDDFFPCRTNRSLLATERMLVMEYISRPLLIHRCKFDVRIYMLVASSDPYLVFYHQGYLRRSLTEYKADSLEKKVYLTNTHFQSMKEGFKLSEHIWSFQTFQEYLTRSGKAGNKYVDSILDPYLKRVANFVFQSGRGKLIRRKGSFQIFGLDFMIDDRFQVHYIEANGFPGYTWSVNFDTRGMVTDLFDLVLEAGEAPAAFELMRAGDNYGGFQMIFSEIEEERKATAYDSCWEFYSNEPYFDILRTANRHFAQFSGHAKSKLQSRDDESDPDDPDIERCKTKKCHAEKKQAKKLAMKARLVTDRLFERFSDELFGARAGEEVLLGSSKSSELATLGKFTQEHGCSINLLGIMPPSYRLENAGDCDRLFKFRTPSAWILKPSDHAGRRGKGFKFYSHQREMEAEFGEQCKDDEARKKNRYIAQKRITNPLLIDGISYDLRSYMLVASAEPLVVFYHPGYARSSRFDAEGQEYVLEEKPPLSFEDLQNLISSLELAGSRFIQTVVETFMRRVMVLVLHSVLKNFKNSISSMKKSYQIFELNFIVDDTLRPWYVGGANGAPEFTLRRTEDGEFDVQAQLMENLKPLILELSDTPDAFSGMRYGDSYGSFRLIYSDYEQTVSNTTYDACDDFSRKWGIPVSQASIIAKVHDVKGRAQAANERELRKYVRAKWFSCRVKRSKESCAEGIRRYIGERYLIYLEKERIRLGGAKAAGGKGPKTTDENVQMYIDSQINELKNAAAEKSSSSDGSDA